MEEKDKETGMVINPSRVRTCACARAYVRGREIGGWVVNRYLKNSPNYSKEKHLRPLATIKPSMDNQNGHSN
jgi:hypothetical protein